MNEEDEGMENRGESRGNRGGDRSGRGGMRIKPDYFMPKPVKVGDEVSVKIEAVASKGDGIAKVDGFVIFVKGAKEGDELKIKITEVKARHANGEIVQ